MTEAPKVLGIRQNLGQFSLLVLVNAMVGALIGLERTIIPALAEQEFQLTAKAGVLSFIAVFGVSKALTNYIAGRVSDRVGRKPVLLVGWLFAVPVPLMLMWAPSWSWVLAANALLGISQGLTWSTTVVMKIDLAGARRRGLAMGLNEFAGYVAVALAAWTTSAIAAHHGLRPQPFYLGLVVVAVGLGVSLFLVHETRGHSALEAATVSGGPAARVPRSVFLRTSFEDRDLSSVCQAGLVNNLNDGMAWGLFPMLFAAAGLDLRDVGLLVAAYPASWGLAQLATGAWSDRVGRKALIVGGMWVQAVGLGVVVLSSGYAGFLAGQVLLGLGTAMVYPTLLAAIGDVAHPSWRASAVGVYRLWRDSGYAVGALMAGMVADAWGVATAVWVVAAVTAASGVVAARRMSPSRVVTVAGTADAAGNDRLRMPAA